MRPIRPMSPEGRPGRELLPGLAAVGRLEDAAVRPAGVEAERLAQPLPERDVEDVRVRRVHDEVDRARLAVVRQAAADLLPRLAAVDRLEQPAVAGVAPRGAARRHPDDVRIRGVGEHLGDALGVLQAHVDERLAAVDGLVDAVAPGHAVADALFTGADPDDVGVLLEERDVADRGAAVPVENRLPRGAGVHRLEHAARRGGDEHLGEVAVERLDVGNAAAHVGRADVPPLEVANEIGRRRLRRERRREREDDQGQAEECETKSPGVHPYLHREHEVVRMEAGSGCPARSRPDAWAQYTICRFAARKPEALSSRVRRFVVRRFSNGSVGVL